MLKRISTFLKRIAKSDNFWTYLFIVLAYIILGYRFFDFILRYTENILLGDQWDIFDYILRENNLLKLFLVQHNEHHIGVGLIITKILAYFSHWNNITETIFIGIVIFTSSIFAFLLKKRLFKKIEIYDIIIPFLFLNLYQWENLIWGFQIAFVLPILFIIITLYLFTFKSSIKRNILILFLSLLSTYSSFHGLFLALVTSFFFLLNYILEKKRKTKIEYSFFLMLTLFIVVSYFINYRSAPFLGSKAIHLRSYLQYVFFQINGFFGYYSYDVYYFFVPFIVTATFVYIICRLIKIKKLLDNYSIISLFILSSLFSLTTAYGRLGLGITQAFQSRYSTFMILLYFGIYLVLQTIKKEMFRKTIIPFLIIFFVFFSNQNNYLNYQQGQEQKTKTKEWKSCYLKLESLKNCNYLSNFNPYPNPDVTNMYGKLIILRSLKMNLFINRSNSFK